MVRNVFRSSNQTHPVNTEQKRSFLTIIDQGFEAYRTTFGRNPGKFSTNIFLNFTNIYFSSFKARFKFINTCDP
jgi:hypothetical protein